MNKNFKVVEINGLSGLLILGFVATGLFCGFILFPIWVVMMGWNNIVGAIFNGPNINYFQASLLWSAFILIFYLLLRNSISIKIQKEEALNHKDIKDIINNIKHKESEQIQEKEESKK